MNPKQPPDITSFVIRFVHPTPADQGYSRKYHGSIRHVQTDREIIFTNWEEAVSFIEGFVSLEETSEK
jgi:hypothetical protein